MKREYNDSKKESTNASAASPTAAIFSNLHRHPHHHLLQPYSTPVHFHHHQQQQQQPFPFPVVSRDGDDESSSGGGGGGNVSGSGNTPGRRTPAPTHSQPCPKDCNDGASIEIQRRPRGRPPGSKNKPKPPVIITQEPDPIMSPYIIEISNGIDVVDAVAKFSRRRNTGLCVLSASGAVANVTIRQPSPNSASTVTFHGRFDILSLSATFLTPAVQAQLPSAALTVAVSLSIPQGQIIGGIVAGPLTAVGTVYVVAASFTSPSYQRLPLEDEAPRLNNTTSSNDQQSPSAASGDNNNNSNAGGGESGTLAIYNCNMASDVIWAPTPRQPY
uniref:PPC domain-containing protein n=1 Tax=Kalanchoe fedtschenkoi TaxID=63787 RepID=A0A7N0USM3_KALFE